MAGAFKWTSQLRHFSNATKPVDTRATIATRAGCFWCGLGRNTPFHRRDSISSAEDDRRSSILQLNTENLTVSRISIIEQLACKNKAVVIILQGTHCTTADKLVTPNFSLWISPEEEARPCHVCSRVDGMDTSQPVSTAMRD